MNRPTQIIRTPYGIFKCLENDLISNQLLTFGAHARNELNMVLDHVQDCHIILDIGAHIGTYAIPMALKNKNLKIFSFEAEAESFELLKENIRLNGLEERIIPILGIVTDDTAASYKIVKADPQNSGANYIEQSTHGIFTTPIIKLSEWLKSRCLKEIDFIKIDAEGMEFRILNDLLFCIQKNHPILYVEMCEIHLNRFDNHLHQLESFLFENGYQCYLNSYKRNSTEDLYIKELVTDLIRPGIFDILAIYSSEC